MIGPHIKEKSDSSPPFYISLNVHDKILHNCLMDSGASHDVIPKVVMDELGLDITNHIRIYILLILRKSNVGELLKTWL
jgi:hypothetical protein